MKQQWNVGDYFEYIRHFTEERPVYRISEFYFDDMCRRSMVKLEEIEGDKKLSWQASWLECSPIRALSKEEVFQKLLET